MNKKQILEKTFGCLFVDNPDPLYIRALAHLGANPVFTYKLKNCEPIVYCGRPCYDLCPFSEIYTPERFQTCYFNICTEEDLNDFEKFKIRITGKFDPTMKYMYFLPFYLYFK